MLTFSPPEDLDQQLVLQFFWLFSSVECALKNSGCLFVDDRRNVHADWKQFEIDTARKIHYKGERSFLHDCSYLLNHPPQRQVKRGEKLVWVEQRRLRNETEVRFVLRMARSVRNNLFHGGKFEYGPIEQVERNARLILAAKRALSICVELRTDIHRHIPYLLIPVVRGREQAS